MKEWTNERRNNDLETSKKELGIARQEEGMKERRYVEPTTVSTGITPQGKANRSQTKQEGEAGSDITRTTMREPR